MNVEAAFLGGSYTNLAARMEVLQLVVSLPPVLEASSVPRNHTASPIHYMTLMLTTGSRYHRTSNQDFEFVVQLMRSRIGKRNSSCVLCPQTLLRHY